MKVYVSSTFVDLKRYRDAAIRILRQLGHEVVAMEDYTSDSAIPLKKVLKDIKACDAYVGIIAWRYGYIPGDKARVSKKKRAIPKGLVLPDSKAGKYGETSITEWEYLQAAENKIPTLAFLLDDESPWPPHLVDGFEEGGSKVKIQSFREILQRDRTVAYFKSPEDLAAKVSAAITRVNMSQLVSVNLLDPDKYTESNLDLVTSDEIVAGGRKEKLVSAVIGAETKAIIRIDIKAAKWWSTRLFLLACLLDKLTDTQQILVVQEEKFVGLLPVPAIIRQFSSSDAELSKFERKVAGSSVNRGAIKKGAEKLIDDWNSILPKRVERAVRRKVTKSNLKGWFGETMTAAALKIDSLTDVKKQELRRLISVRHDYVPVVTTRVSKKAKPERLLVVVDKAVLNETLAGNYLNFMQS